MRIVRERRNLDLACRNAHKVIETLADECQTKDRRCFLNGESINDNLLRKIRECRYTYVLSSPELAISERFRRTMLDPNFKDRLVLVVMDEAHLMQLWGGGRIFEKIMIDSTPCGAY